MSIDVTVPNSFSSGPQTLQDQNNVQTSLTLGNNQAIVIGQDIVGGALPLQIRGQAVGSGQQTWGRLIRLVGIGGPNNFFDIGIDQNGNLFLNGPSSTATNHILSVSPTGAITIP